MLMRKVTAVAACALLAAAPIAVQAQTIAPPAAVEQVEGDQMFGNSSAAIGIGFLVLIALMAAIVAGNGDRNGDLDPGRPITP